MNGCTAQCVLLFSYPRLRDLSTPETWACLQYVRKFLQRMDASLLLLYLNSTFAGMEKCGCFFSPVTKVECAPVVCLTQCYQSVSTHLLFWPVENGPQWRMTHRLTSLSLDDWKSQWLIGVLIYLSCWINSTASLLGIFFLENVAGWPNFCLTLWGLSNHPQLQKQFIGPLT